MGQDEIHASGVCQKNYPLKSLLDVQRYTKKSVPDAINLYVLQEDKSSCVLCSLSSKFYSIEDTFSADRLNIKFYPR